MLFKKTVGKYVIQVCTNISCMLCNAKEILRHLTSRLGNEQGETTPDQICTRSRKGLSAFFDKGLSILPAPGTDLAKG
jgi:NADH:ubiquinone oxidoreductase subunit E